jgi:hypothetical protein
VCSFAALDATAGTKNGRKTTAPYFRCQRCGKDRFGLDPERTEPKGGIDTLGGSMAVRARSDVRDESRTVNAVPEHSIGRPTRPSRNRHY